MISNVYILVLVNITTAICYSLPIPMYPTLAYEHGVNESLLGLIFAIYSASIICVIPFTNYLIEKIGRDRMIVILSLMKVHFII